MTIQEMLEKLSNKSNTNKAYICKVDSVDKDNKCVDITPISGEASFLEINLQPTQSNNSGILAIPKVGTHCLFIATSQEHGIILACDEIEELHCKIGETSIEIINDTISFNGGSETFANASELQKQLKTMSGRIDGIINAIKTAVPVAQDGGVAFQTTMLQALNSLTSESFDSIVDTKILH